MSAAEGMIRLLRTNKSLAANLTHAATMMTPVTPTRVVSA